MKTEDQGELVITKNDAGHIVAVTRQDAAGRVLSTLAISAPIYPAAVAPVVLPAGWVAIPLEPTAEQWRDAQGTLLDMRWDAESIKSAVESLVRRSLANGYVVTVTNTPLKPLAMGHSGPVIDVRLSRATQAAAKEGAQQE